MDRWLEPARVGDRASSWGLLSTREVLEATSQLLSTLPSFWTSTSGRSGADCSPPLGPCYRTPRGSLEEQPRPAAGVGRLQHTDQGSSGARLHWLSPDLPLSLGLTRLSLFLCEMTVPARRTEGVALLSKRQWVWGHRRHEGGTPKIYPYPWLL